MAFNLTPTSALNDLAFGLDLLASLGTNYDAVAILDGTSQVFAQARPMKAVVRETSKVMEHPVETGVVLADHHIINPVEIDIPLIVPAIYYAAVYQQIKASFVDATLLTVKTKASVYQNMIIADMPHDEDPEMYDVITIGLHLRQVLYVVPNVDTSFDTTDSFNTAASYSPADPADSNTVQSGLQSPVALGTGALTAAASALSYLKLLKAF